MSATTLKKIHFSLLPRLMKKAGTDRGTTYKIAAAAFTKKGNFIDIRYNSHRMYLSNRHGAGLHAEQDLIHKYGKMIDTIYLIRVGGTGNILPIDPCPTCSKIAEKMGIKIIPLHYEYEDEVNQKNLINQHKNKKHKKHFYEYKFS